MQMRCAVLRTPSFWLACRLIGETCLTLVITRVFSKQSLRDDIGVCGLWRYFLCSSWLWIILDVCGCMANVEVLFNVLYEFELELEMHWCTFVWVGWYCFFYWRWMERRKRGFRLTTGWCVIIKETCSSSYTRSFKRRVFNYSLFMCYDVLLSSLNRLQCTSY